MDSRADGGPTGRVVPYNIEAEEAILGSLLIDPDAIRFGRAAPDPMDGYGRGGGRP